MLKSTLPALMGLTLALGACTTAPGGGASADEDSMQIKHDDADVPAQVRAIEVRINQKAAIMAEEIEISVSKNYEWDVSLTGDRVSAGAPPQDGGQVSIAEGHARAMFRNLDIRAWKRIVFKRSGLNVVPFIKITAKGRAAYAVMDEANETPVVRRAPVIRINNAQIQFMDTPGRFSSRSTTDPAPAAGNSVHDR